MYLSSSANQVQLHFKVRSRLEKSILKTGWWNFSYHQKDTKNCKTFIFWCILIWSTYKSKEDYRVLYKLWTWNCSTNSEKQKQSQCANCTKHVGNSLKNQLSNFGLIKETLELFRILLVAWKRKKMYDLKITSWKDSKVLTWF